MKKFLLVLVSLTVALHVSATGTHWVPDIYKYNDNMSVVAEIYINDILQTSTDLEIGAFCDDEVRGSQMVTYYGEPFFKYAVYLTIYGETDNQITFRLYDHSTETELAFTSPEPLTFIPNGTIGNLINPHVLNFTMSETPYTFFGSGSWTLPSNWKGKDGSVLTELPDFTNEDIVIDGMAFIPNGESVIVKSLTINSEKVLEINNGASLEVTGKIDNNDDANSLVLNDGGQIFQNNENVKATFRRNIVNPANWSGGGMKDGWQFISCPITDAAVEDFIPETGGYDLFIWENLNVDDDENEVPWVNYKAHVGEEEGDYADFFDGDFYQGCGYLASYQSVATADFVGNLNSETSCDFSDLLWYNKKWTWKLFLLGNPFTFDVEWSDFDKTNVTDGFMILNPETGSYSYKTEGTIKVGEGFVVQTTGTKNLNLSYSASSKKDKGISNNINVTVSNSKGNDNVILSFNGSENGGFPKMENFNDEIATVFTLRDNVKYGISSNDADVKEIPLCFDAKEIGTYTISMKPSGDFNYIHLIDRMTGEDIDMLLESEYKFNALGSDNVNRFIVRLSNGDEINGNDNFAYQSGNQLYINEIGTIQIIDLTGRVVINETLSGNSVDISCLRNAAYIVRLVSENGVKTQKIVVL